MTEPVAIPEADPPYPDDLRADLGYVMAHVEAQALTDPVPDAEVRKLRDYLVTKSHAWAKYRNGESAS